MDYSVAIHYTINSIKILHNTMVSIITSYYGLQHCITLWHLSICYIKLWAHYSTLHHDIYCFIAPHYGLGNGINYTLKYIFPSYWGLYRCIRTHYGLYLHYTIISSYRVTLWTLPLCCITLHNGMDSYILLRNWSLHYTIHYVSIFHYGMNHITLHCELLHCILIWNLTFAYITLWTVPLHCTMDCIITLHYNVDRIIILDWLYYALYRDWLQNKINWNQCFWNELRWN